MEKKIRVRKGALVVLIAVTALFVLAVAAVGTYAAYTNSRNAQRTVATYDSQGERFSSNALAKGNSRDNVHTVYVSDASIAPSTAITVCNYERGKQTYPNPEEVRYAVLLRLVRYDGASEEKYVPVDAAYMTANELTGYTVTVTKGGSTVTLSASHLSDSTFSGILTARETSSDVYTMTFDTDFAPDQPNLYVEMIVAPVNAGLQTLRGVFKTDIRAQGTTNAWTGSFSDDTSVPPSGYDGFNYIVMGVGDGTVTVTWDETRVALSYKSLSDILAIDGATSTANSVSFPVDSDENSRYDLQFYKVNITSETWSNMNATVVRFRFV